MLETYKVIRSFSDMNEDMDYFFLLDPLVPDSIYDIIEKAETAWQEENPCIPLGEYIALAIKDSGIKIYSFLTNETKDENEYHLLEV